MIHKYNYKMPNYQNGKIYKICSHNTNEIYIGSTCQSINKRMSNHRYDYNKHLKGGKKETTSYEILKHKDAYIELIELYPCNNSKELSKREGYFIKTLKSINRCVAGQTKKEYYEKNKIKIDKYQKEYMKEYSKKHIMDKKKYDKLRTSISYNCECGGKYRANSKKRHERSDKHNNYVLSL